MGKIKIIVDSACDIPKELAFENNITVLPLGIVFDGDVHYDGEDLDIKKYLKELRNMSEIPTTSMVPLYRMEEEFKKNLDIYEHQIFITLSSKASGTYNAANLIKQQIEDIIGKQSNITIIDSFGFSMIYGKIALTMAKMSDQGASYEEIMHAYKCEREVSTAYFVVDDLHHLQKGGRIKPGIAMVGGLLGIKPILTIKDGLVDSIGKERGKRRAFEKIVDMMIADIKNPQNEEVWVANADADADITEIIDIIKSKINPKIIIVYDMGACIATHAGAGLVGLIFNKR